MNAIQKHTMGVRGTRGREPNDFDKVFRKCCNDNASLQLGGTTTRSRQNVNLAKIQKTSFPSSFGGSKGIPREVRNQSLRRMKSTPIISPSSSFGGRKGAPRELCNDSLRRMKSCSTLSMSRAMLQTSRVQRRRKSLAAVHADSCYQVQAFFKAKNGNILNELSDMEKPTNESTYLEEDGEHLSLSDLAGLISLQTQGAIERGSFYDPRATFGGLAGDRGVGQSYNDDDFRSNMYTEEQSTASLMLSI